MTETGAGRGSLTLLPTSSHLDKKLIVIKAQNVRLIINLPRGVGGGKVFAFIVLFPGPRPSLHWAVRQE